MKGSETTHRIIVVEDNPGDVRLIRLALKRNGIDCELKVIGDGECAIQYVRSQGDTDTDLILLDLNLPRRSGVEVLESLRQSEPFSSVPVIVLSSAGSPREREQCVRLGASMFLEKGVELDERLRIGERVKSALARH